MPRKKVQLSAEERDGELGFSLWKELTDNVSSIRDKKIRNAEIFTDLYDKQLHKSILGDEQAPWAALLSQVEVFYTRAEVARWMLIWKTLHTEFGLDLTDLLGIPETRLEAVAKRCENAGEAKRYLELAKTASSSDWADEVLKLRGKPTKETCQHIDGFKKIEVCPRCGLRHSAKKIDHAEKDLQEV